jgi:multisubunit Na+/H+ antiporter MnhF subunit
VEAIAAIASVAAFMAAFVFVITSTASEDKVVAAGTLEK